MITDKMRSYLAAFMRQQRVLLFDVRVLQGIAEPTFLEHCCDAS